MLYTTYIRVYYLKGITIQFMYTTDYYCIITPSI